MTEQINAYRKLFQDSVELALQVTRPLIAPYVTMGSYAGGEKTRLILRAGSKNTRPRTVRGAAMEFGDISLQQRWITGYDWDVEPDMVDSMDKIRMGIDPGGYITQAHAAAVARNTDQEIINAFFASAKVGDDGNATVAYDTGNSVAASASGLTVAKLKEMSTILLDNHVDIVREKPCIAITPKQREDLLGDIQTTSKDFNGGGSPLKDGVLQDFMGFHFIVVASDTANDFGLPVDGSSNRRCPVWTKSAMHYGTWQAPSTSIDQRTDVRGKPFQFYTMGNHGAARVEEGKVGEILCAES